MVMSAWKQREDLSPSPSHHARISSPLLSSHHYCFFSASINRIALICLGPRPAHNCLFPWLLDRLSISRYIEIFQSKRMDYYSAIVGQLQAQVKYCQDKILRPAFHVRCARPYPGSSGWAVPRLASADTLRSPRPRWNNAIMRKACTRACSVLIYTILLQSFFVSVVCSACPNHCLCTRPDSRA